jgi:hypothetical protein
MAALGLALLMTGCRVIGTAGCCVFGAVGLAGYAVYKTGEVAVTGVGNAAKATGNALSSGTKSVATVVYYDNELKTECPASVPLVWDAANRAFKNAGFLDIAGDRDGLSGVVTAKTWDRTDLTLKLKSLGPQSTELRVRVGVKGDMETAETVFMLIKSELAKGTTP